MSLSAINGQKRTLNKCFCQVVRLQNPLYQYQPHQFYKMFKELKLPILATLLLLIPQLSAGGKAICLPQDAPVSEFLQATLLKQLQAEYIANLTNTLCTNLNSPQLSQIQNAIFSRLTTPSSRYYRSSTCLLVTLHLPCYTHVKRSRPSIPTASQTTTR